MERRQSLFFDFSRIIGYNRGSLFIIMMCYMTNIPETTRNNVEQENKKNKVKPDESLAKRAIRDFIEQKLSGMDGHAVYQKIRDDIGYRSGQLKTSFLEFVNENPDYSEQNNVQKEVYNNIEGIRFFREALRQWAGYESKREAL